MTRPIVTPELVSALSRAVPGRAFRVWVYLWARANRETSRAWPSLRTIGRDLGIKSESICRDIKVLESLGWLKVQRNGVNTYCVTDPRSVSPKTSTPPSESVPQNVNPVSPKTSTPRPPKRQRHLNTTKNTTKNTKRAKKPSFDPKSLPRPFTSDRFRRAWSDFCQHRAESKHPLTELATTKLLAKCERFGEANAIEALDTAVENCWRGIFPPKPSENGNGQPTGVPKSPALVCRPDGTFSPGEA